MPMQTPPKETLAKAGRTTTKTQRTDLFSKIF
jgi:hypothetical protein